MPTVDEALRAAVKAAVREAIAPIAWKVDALIRRIDRVLPAARVPIPGPRRKGRPRTIDHPFPRALDAAGVSPAQWAKQHGLTLEKVRSWYGPSQPRRIERKYALAIDEEFGLPADTMTWPHGIR
jgi:hypothetical protein